MAVSNKLRFEILRRDRFRCRYCGASAAEAVLEIDHVVPRARGGVDAPTNLVAACDTCNSGKGDTPLDALTVRDIPEVTFRIACLSNAAPNPQTSQEYEAFCTEGASIWGDGWEPMPSMPGEFEVAFALAVTSGYSRVQIITACRDAGQREEADICLFLPSKDQAEDPEEARAYDEAVEALSRFIYTERRDFIWRARVAAADYQPTPRELIRAAHSIGQRHVEEEGRDYAELERWLISQHGGSGFLATAAAEWDGVWQGRAGHSSYECRDEVLEVAVSYLHGGVVPGEVLV